MRSLVLALFLCSLSPISSGYSVLTHEAILDTAWDQIRTVLLSRFPGAAQDALKDAHAYAYGGCIIQDMGYYPFGSKRFSDLVHYVRSGDFVLAMVRQARDVNEYAFALGAVAHYAADNIGHPVAVNRSVPLEYPKLAARYGNVMTYEQDPPAHLKTEFGFDVLQVAHGLYAPQSYHDFIGFKVAKPVLERAFQDVYCIPLNKLFKSEDLALGTYRRAVGTLIPESTKVAWNLKQDEIVKLEPGMTKHRFLYNLSRASYEKEWDEEYERPGILARILAFLFRLIPKVGPFRGLSFRPPTPETEKLFMESFNRTLAEYRRLLGELKARRLALPNTDLDTGRPTQPGEYRMADAAYAQLLGKLANGDFEGLSPDLRGNLLWYYRDPNAAVAGLRKKEDQQKTLAALERLRGTRIRACVSCEAGTSGRDCACHVTGM